MEQYFALLRQCPLFQGISPQELSQMLPCLGTRHMQVKKHQMIFPCRRPGTLGRFGAVRRCPCHSGRLLWQPQHCLYVPASSAFWGGFCLRRCGVSAGQCGGCPGQHPSAAGLSACHPHVQRRLCLSQRLLSNLLHVVAAKNLLLTQKLSFLSKRTTKEKLMAYLMEEARGRQPHFRLPYDRQGLAITWAWTAAPCRLS